MKADSKAGLLRHLSAALLFIFAASALAQQSRQPGQLDGSETLFTVLAAINAAGYDADLDSAANYPIRKQIREMIEAKHLESVDEIGKFFAAHRQKNFSA